MNINRDFGFHFPLPGQNEEGPVVAFEVLEEMRRQVLERHFGLPQDFLVDSAQSSTAARVQMQDMIDEAVMRSLRDQLATSIYNLRDGLIRAAKATRQAKLRGKYLMHHKGKRAKRGWPWKR